MNGQDRQLLQAIQMLSTNIQLLRQTLEKLNKEGIRVVTQESHS